MVFSWGELHDGGVSAAAVEHAGEGTARPSAPGSVLLVEDDQKLAAILARAMAREGLSITHVTTGDGALAAVRAAPDLGALVLDIMIPHPDGIEVCNQLRRDGWAGPIVAVSALDGPHVRTHVRRAGADVFLPKPVQLSQLVDTVLVLIEGGAGGSAARRSRC